MITKRRKEQKQVVVKHKDKIYTEARYFTLKRGSNSTNKERKQDKEFVKQFIFFKMNKWEVLIRSGGVGKRSKS